MKITMVHGSGGKETSELITGLFARYLGNPVLARMEDSAVVPGAPVIAMTTDSFVVTPLFFPGGDIGRLAVCGTVNDLAMSGAVPKYLTCGFILEEGAETGELERIVQSMAQAAEEAGVVVIAGDTKVIGGSGGMYINTSGVGFFSSFHSPNSSESLKSSNPSNTSNSSNSSNLPDSSNMANASNLQNSSNLQDSSIPLVNSSRPVDFAASVASAASVEPPIRAANCQEGDLILLSGFLGDHHAAILSARMNIINKIQSDCAPLNHMTAALMESGVKIRSMRDVTRGGLATVLHEIAAACSRSITLQESQIPVSDSVRGFCGILGLDPLYMGNEGKMIAIVAKDDAPAALACMKSDKYGQNASIIGEITGGKAGLVVMDTRIGGTRIIPELYGEGLPRIC